MSDINRQIAEWMGWILIPNNNDGFYVCHEFSSIPILTDQFDIDLNACALFEKKLKEDPELNNESYAYGDNLANLVMLEFTGQDDFEEPFSPNGWGYLAVSSATASQKCEALSKTVDLKKGG